MVQIMPVTNIDSTGSTPVGPQPMVGPMPAPPVAPGTTQTAPVDTRTLISQTAKPGYIQGYDTQNNYNPVFVPKGQYVAGISATNKNLTTAKLNSATPINLTNVNGDVANPNANADQIMAAAKAAQDAQAQKAAQDATNPPPTKEATDFQQILNNIATGNQSVVEALNTEQTGLNSLNSSDLKTQIDDINSQLSANLAKSAALDKSYQNANLSALGNSGDLFSLNGVQNANYRNYAIAKNQIAADTQILQGTLAGVQGKYDTAKNLITAAFDSKVKVAEAQTKAWQSQADAIRPTLDKQEAAHLELVKRQQDKIVQDAKDLKDAQTKAISDLYAAGVQVDANIAQALNNAKTVGDVNNVMAKYAPQLAASGKLDLQGKQLDLQYKQSEINKNNAAAIKDAQSKNQTLVSVTTSDGKQISVPTDVSPYLNTSNSRVNYVDASTLQGTAAEKKRIVDQAQAAGLKVIFNKNTIADLSNIKDANNKLDTVVSTLNNLTNPSWVQNFLVGRGLTKLANLTQSDPQKAAAGALSSIGLDILKSISGVQGFRGNQTAVQQVTDHLPSIYDTQAVVAQKVDYIRQLISDREDGLLGVSSTQNTHNGVILPKVGSNTSTSHSTFNGIILPN